MNVEEHLYNLIHSFRLKEAVTFARRYYQPSDKGKGFFINYSDAELLDLIKTIRNSKVMLKIGFTEAQSNIALSIVCVYYCYPKFDFKEKLRSSIVDLEEILIKSRYVVNKDLPFVDLINLIKGHKVYKPKY